MNDKWKALINQSLLNAGAGMQRLTQKAENIPEFNFADDVAKKNALLGVLAWMGQGLLNIPSHLVQGTTRTGNALGELARGDNPTIGRLTSGAVPLAEGIFDASMMTNAGRKGLEKSVGYGLESLARLAKPAEATAGRYLMKDGLLAGSRPMVKKVAETAVEDAPQWVKTATGWTRSDAVPKAFNYTAEDLAKYWKQFVETSPGHWTRR